MGPLNKKRIVNLKLLESYRGKPCLVCGASGVGHHVRSKGSFGHDIEINLMPLCGKHHTEVHAIGLNRFCEKYEKVNSWLLENKWEFDKVLSKWRNENAGN